MIGVRGCRTLVTLAGPARPRVGPELDTLAAIDDSRRSTTARCSL